MTLPANSGPPSCCDLRRAQPRQSGENSGLLRNHGFLARICPAPEIETAVERPKEDSMNDSDLDKQLKAARVPARDEDYWESFPRLVSAKLRTVPGEASGVSGIACPGWPGARDCLCCYDAGFYPRPFGRSEEKNDLMPCCKTGRMLREVLTLFPNRVRAIVQDEHGVQLVLAGQPDVPVSTPIYVRICDGNMCVAGDLQRAGTGDCRPKSDNSFPTPAAESFLMGNQFVWSSTAAERRAKKPFKDRSRS